MANEVVVRQSDEVGIFTPPDIVLDNAMTAAKALMKVVSLKKKPVIMNGEQYLEYEDWQTCGQFYGYTVKTGDAVLVDIDGVKGAKARADLINVRTGEVIGGAEAYCMRDEEKWSTRPKYEWQGEGDKRKRVKVGEEIVPWFQLASMAQTRAGAKAFRNRLAWVVVLAGYRPTPAEEMIEGTVSEAVKERRTVDKTEHYCSVHNVNFFMKGRMKGYAHPIDGTDPVEWCHEHKDKPQAKTAVADEPEPEKPASPAEPEAPSEAVTSAGEPPEPAPSIIDLDWLREALVDKLQWHDAGAYLGKKYKVTGKKISEMISQLTPEQQREFAEEVESRLQLL